MAERTLGITKEADLTLKELTEHFGFNQDKEAALFAFSYAIRENLPRGIYNGKITKWNMGSFKEIDFEQILELCYPSEKIDDVTDMVSDLMHAGIFALEKCLRKNSQLKISDFFSIKKKMD